MSISFGVGTLSILQNLEITGAIATTGSSGVPAQNVQVSSGLVMIEGVTAIVSAVSASFTIAGSTGSGLLVYAYLDASSTTTITATIAIATAADPINTGANIPTGICPLYRFSAGTAANAVGTFLKWSGGSATRAIGKVQNVSIGLSYEPHQMRGGGDLYPTDTKFSDAKIEGSFEFADQTASQLQLFGGIYASAGSASGTWTLSAVSVPEPFSLVFQNTTNGITAVYAVMKAYLTQNSNDFGRSEYLQPSYNFVAQSNFKGTVMTIQA